MESDVLKENRSDCVLPFFNFGFSFPLISFSSNSIWFLGNDQLLKVFCGTKKSVRTLTGVKNCDDSISVVRIES